MKQTSSHSNPNESRCDCSSDDRKKSDARESVLSVMPSKVFSVIPQIKTQNPMPDRARETDRQMEADKERGEKREMRGLFPFDHISSFISSFVNPAFPRTQASPYVSSSSPVSFLKL